MTKAKNRENIKYYLGLDWGSKKCGLAVADGETKIASPLEEAETRELTEKIKKLQEMYRFTMVIVGSINQGKMKNNQKQIEKIISGLEKEGLVIETEEEMFSTRLAQQNLSETAAKNISKNDNAESARIILQSWLDKQA